MSAKEDLDRLEHDWAIHIKWRKGHASSNLEGAPGKYVNKNGSFDRTVRLTEVPRSVADVFWRDAEAVIGAALDARYQALHRELRMRARAEAERILADIPAEEALNHKETD